MNDWTGGYVADINYTYGYYPEINPYRAKYAFLQSGYDFPKVKTACELGFGQGMSINIHSASSDIQWYGTDFNPSQAAFAKQLGASLDPAPKIFDNSFQEFLERDDLPGFDFIALHGIWSWVSDENRQIIVDFIDKYLNIGGVLYISYNCMPGWTPMLPVREFMAQYAENMCAKGMRSDDKVAASLSFMKKLIDTNPILTSMNPSIKKKFEDLLDKDKSYLAHEYFNANWKPMSFMDMSSWLGQARLEFICSANYNDFIDFINLTNEQSELLNSIPDKSFREFTMDYMMSRQFRREYWVRGSRKLSKEAHSFELLNTKLASTQSLNDFEYKIAGVIGSADLKIDFYKPILASLADKKIHTVREIFQTLIKFGVAEDNLSQTLMILVAKGFFTIVADNFKNKEIAKRAAAFNASVLTSTDGNPKLLASPLSGGAVKFNDFQTMFLAEMKKGHKNSESLAKALYSRLNAKGQRVTKNGKPILEEAEAFKELQISAEEFMKSGKKLFDLLGV